MALPQKSTGTFDLKALRRGSDGWVLLVEELVRVTSGHYKPKRASISGEAQILSVLSQHRRGEFVDAAKLAMAGDHGAYRIVGDRLEARRSDIVPGGVSPDLGRLARRCEALEKRVADLEGTLRRLAKGASRRQSQIGGSRPPSSSPPKGGGGSGAPSGREPQGRDPQNTGASASSSAASPAASPDASPASSAAENAALPSTPAASPAAGTEPRIAAPSVSILDKALSEMLNHDAALQEVDEPLDPGATHYVADLLGDDDERLGALVVDLKAVVFQAGTLMMMEQDAMTACLEETPSDDLVDAMKEILNAQGRAIGSISTNPNFRIRDLSPVSEETKWIDSMPHRTAYADAFGGRMWLVSS